MVETTPGQSQKLLKTSETVNLTEKINGSQQGHKIQHNDGNNSFLGSLLVLTVELLNGIAGENNNQIDIYKGTYMYRGT